jgi:type II secretory pathway pseudopilin PulG
MPDYADGVTHECVISQSRPCQTRPVKLRWGLLFCNASRTQGALRDPGFWGATPSALSRNAHWASAKRRALSLIEVVASTLIVGLMAVAALNSLGAATRSSESIGNRAVALGLADELLSEILQTAYSEPSGATGIGADGAEAAGPRSAFDDVDDYHGWNQSPPQYRDGTVMPDRAEWRQRVEVTRITSDDLISTAGSDQGVKRIRVTIEYRDEVLAELIAVRTDIE